MLPMCPHLSEPMPEPEEEVPYLEREDRHQEVPPSSPTEPAVPSHPLEQGSEEESLVPTDCDSPTSAWYR